MSPDQEYVMKTVESRDVHFVRFWFVDVMGRIKSFAVNPNELEGAFEEGMGFDAGYIDGLSVSGERDMLAHPDASTFQVLPWRPDSNAVARMFCDIRTPDGGECPGDSRKILERLVAGISEEGFVANVGPEVEYFYFTDSHNAELLDHGGYFDLTELDSGTDLRRDTVLALEKMGVPVEYSHHEAGPSQHEIDLRHSDACSMADAVVTYKTVVKEIASSHGVYASFMPRPRADCPGSGMHVHMSLFDHDDRNVFFDPQDEGGFNLSGTARHFIAGLLAYAPQYCLVTNQYVNSYRRLAGGADAPFALGWGRSNRHTLVSVPGYRPNKQAGCRVELRLPDPACNPYLAFAAILSAGMRGIRDEMPLDPPLQDTLLDPAGGSGRGTDGLRLPETLGDAIRYFEESDFMREVLGEKVHAYLVEVKKREWREYLCEVGQWERDRWMEVL